MPTFREGKVVRIGEVRADLVKATIALPDSEIEAVGFPGMLGPLNPGDRVVVNTTGIELGLGTGGVGFIAWNLDGPGPVPELKGHIVKLRYTPWQKEVLAAEERGSPHHDRLARIDSIDGMPVVACSLHSQIAGVAAGIKAESPDVKVGYMMTDGACLPIAWSDLVADLRSHELIDVTCTSGHAFGADLETVNIYSGLAALRVAADVDVAIVAMGPGVVGTGTTLGHTALEQGQILDAANALGGEAFACLRVSFSDPRPRHQGVSHHTMTALTLVAHTRATVVVPELLPEQAGVVDEQLTAAEVASHHEIVRIDGAPGIALLRGLGLRPSSMGRSFEEIPELFLAASAAGRVAASTP